jgi:heme-degrading monooxygenase HmoA
MIARIWRTQIDETRANDYREFAHSKSLPMFRSQPGFAGVLFAARGAERAVITLWRDAASVDALDHSETYSSIVEEIEGTGFLKGESKVEVFELEEICLEQSVTSPEELRATHT